ncbi:MAG: delta-60 repeat domain-containing protein [Verrucomicrobia bacterium]|nr:delta-60 repeat domain-containing protein [Verrucomicrobiota bacterium]
MKTLSSLNLLLAFCVPWLWASADPGAVDPTFDTGTTRMFSNPESVVGATMLADGSVVLSRTGPAYAGSLGQLIKILPDGRQDYGFVVDPTFRYSGFPELLTEINPGRLLVTGNYQPAGFSQGLVFALDAQGRRDTNYPAERLTTGLNTVLLGLADGGVLLGRQMQAGQPLVVQLDPAGRRVATFDSNLRGPGLVTGIRKLSDGRLLVVGFFTPPGRTGGQSLGRLLPDGTWDESFELPAEWPKEPATGLWPAPDERNWIGLRHRASGNVRLYRIPGDGDVNEPGDLWMGDPEQSEIGAVVSDGAGGVWVGGRQLVRLKPDGQIDTTASPPRFSGNETIVQVLLRFPDGSLLVGGGFAEVVLAPGETLRRPGFFRWLPDGSVDANYGRQGFWSASTVTTPQVVINVPMSDGSLVVGGQWNRFNGVPAGSLSRITATGARDTHFALDRTRFPGVLSAAELGDGGLLVGSTALISVNGVASSPLVWLSRAGELRSITNLPGTVLALERMPDGSVIVAGRFAEIPVNVSPSLRRVTADGQLDPTWSIDLDIAQIRVDNRILLRAYDDQRVLVGLTAPGEVRRYRLDGSLDPEFEAKPAEPTGADLPLRDLAVSDDGSILASGSFLVANQSVTALRWHPNGRRDHEFRAILRSALLEVEPATDGRFVLAGSRQTPVRILPDGALDPTFSSPTNLVSFRGLESAGSSVYGMAQFQDSRPTQSAYRFIRLENEAYTLAPPEPTPEGIRLKLVAPAGEAHVVEISRTLRDWSPVAALVMPTNRVVEWLLPPQFTQDVQFFRDRRLE